MPAPHHSVFYRPDALPAAQLTASTHFNNTVGNFKPGAMCTIQVIVKHIAVMSSDKGFKQESDFQDYSR